MTRRRTGLTLTITCLLASVLAGCDAVHARAYRMASGSMEPAIAEDSLVFTLRLSEEGRARIERGDVVIFDAPGREGTVFLKRVVALGGDSVALREGRLWVNGDAVAEDYGRHPALRRPEAGAPATWEDYGPFVVPAGHLFVLGDNWDRSLDSRRFGPIAVDSVVARRIW